MIKILTVCLGNICRSPIAEEVLRQKCQELGLDVFVDSAGTANYHVGCAPDKRMIQTAANFGYNINQLRARQFKTSDFDQFDYIFTMDSSNKSNVLRLSKSAAHQDKVHSYQEFAGINNPDYVPDPYYGDADDFIETFEIVEQSAALIAQKLKELHQ